MVDHKFLVGIRCNTYNQAKYITDALNGFAMQQTTFPFVAMVVDDASTDGEREVITDYLKANFDIENTDVAYKEETEYAYITFAQHNTNKNCYFAVLLLKENHYQKKLNYKKFDYIARWRETTKYEALCEGDDYWIDPQKLQKQVDFLENNPEYGLVHTDFQFVDTDDNILPTPDTPLYKNIKERVKNGYVWDSLLVNKGFILTCTILYRRQLFDGREKRFIDHGLFMMIARKSKIHYFNTIMSSYRRNPNGIMLSSHKIVSNSMMHVLMHQLYYYHSQEFETADYYKKSISSLLRRLECFASIIIRGGSNLFKERKILTRLICYNPLYILLSPLFALIVIFKKLILKK